MKTLLTLFVLFFSSSAVAQIPGVNIKDLTKLKTDQIITAVKGKQQTGIYNDGTNKVSVKETYFPDGRYKILFGNKNYTGQWKAKNNKICYKEGTKTKFECVKMYVRKEGGKKVYYFVTQGIVYQKMDKSISLVQLQKDIEKKRAAEIKRQEELKKKASEQKKKAEEKRIAEEKRKAEEKRIAEEKRLAEEKAAEEKKLAEEKIKEKKRKERKKNTLDKYIKQAKEVLFEIEKLLDEVDQDYLSKKSSDFIKSIKSDIKNNEITLTTYIWDDYYSLENEIEEIIFQKKGELEYTTNPGFRDLKPGLHLDKANKICRLVSYSKCYGIENIRFKGLFRNKVLDQLTLDMGPIVDQSGSFMQIFNDILGEDESNIYLKMKNTLNSKYKLEFQYSERDRQLFNENEKKYLLAVYGGGQVTILINRKKRNDYNEDLWLYIVYRGVEAGKMFLESERPVRAETSDF